MQNFIQPGDVLTVPAPYDVASGDLVVVGNIVGVAAFGAASGAPVEVKTSGVFELPKTSAQAWTVGVPVYWHADNKVLTTTASTNVPVGHAVAIAANPTSHGKVRLSF